MIFHCHYQHKHFCTPRFMEQGMVMERTEMPSSQMVWALERNHMSLLISSFASHSNKIINHQHGLQIWGNFYPLGFTQIFIVKKCHRPQQFLHPILASVKIQQITTTLERRWINWWGVLIDSKWRLVIKLSLLARNGYEPQTIQKRRLWFDIIN